MLLKRLRSLLGTRKAKTAVVFPAQDPAFDPDWYLQAYPDVARAGVDPWQHYLLHGKAEGRQPSRNRAVTYDHHLWRGLGGVMEARLQRLLDGAGNEREADYARWALARWYAWRGDQAAAIHLLQPLQCRPFTAPVHAGPVLLCLQVLLQQGDTGTAAQVLRVNTGCNPGTADLALARCNLAVVDNPSVTLPHRFEALNACYARNGLAALEFAPEESLSLFDRLQAPAGLGQASGPGQAPLISVVVPVFNAGAGLETALRSLSQQTWPSLEVLVVDDASTDDSATRASRLCSELSGPGRAFHLIRHPHNQGAYAARNTGMEAATGELLTVQDADDWSHPSKLQLQAEALLGNADLRASVSHWVRADADLIFGRWRVEEGWMYRNVSSLMIRRSVLAQLGFWDEVRVNADTEYYYRILAAWGADSLAEVLPGVPLAFGRSAEQSLSQAEETHLVTQFSGLRKDYMDAARRWHASAQTVEALYLERGKRVFAVPPAMLPKASPAAPGPETAETRHLQDWFQQSGWFDGAWYLRRNPDLQQVEVDAFEHWWQCGAGEGRDPGPALSLSVRAWRYGQSSLAATDVAAGLQSRKVPAEAVSHLLLTGDCEAHAGQPWIMVCGHQAGSALFGAERSLLDVLMTLQVLAVNVLVVLPEAGNPEYIRQVQGCSQQLAVLPMAWWQQGADPCPVTISQLKRWLREFEVSQVYLNTVVHWEPALAGRACGVPVLVHARELPGQDPSLCDLLNATPDQVREHALACADTLVANSRYLADDYQAPVTAIVPNIVHGEDFRVDLPPPGRLRVGMISSNLPKKGLDDFIAVAGELARRQAPVTCVLIGPDNPHVALLKAAAERGELPPGFEFSGYEPVPAQALAGLHVVVNLSRFEESFGRSVLEAMAAGRAVVCYAHGALPELVEDGQTGFLVPPGNVKSVADALERLAADAALLERMGVAGRETALRDYSLQVMVAGLRKLVKTQKP